MIHIYCLISGSGSNFEVLKREIDKNYSKIFNIIYVISNKDNVYGLERAKNLNIATEVIKFEKPKNYKELNKNEKQIIRDNYEDKIYQFIKNDFRFNSKNTVILCLGWMHILGKKFIQNFNSLGVNIYNLHPSLPNDNKLIGINSIDRAYRQFLEGHRVFTGIMIHEVIPEVDKGRCLVYNCLRINENIELYKLEINMIEKKTLLDFIKILKNKIRIKQ